MSIVSRLIGHAQRKTTVTKYLHIQDRLAADIIAGKGRGLNRLLEFDPVRLNSQEAAAILVVGVRNIQHLAKTGQIPALRFKGKLSFDEGDLLLHKLNMESIKRRRQRDE